MLSDQHSRARDNLSRDPAEYSLKILRVEAEEAGEMGLRVSRRTCQAKPAAIGGGAALADLISVNLS